MIPILGFVGKSGSGKTTLILSLIRELARRGYRVAAIKHTRHPVDIDQPGKDSALMHEAGAAAVALCSENRLAMYLDPKEPWAPENIVTKLFPEVDLCIVEGYSEAALPRIAVVRKGMAETLPDVKGLIAVVTDLELASELPRYTFDQISAIADLLEGYIKRLGPKREVKLYVNEKKVFIKPFIKDFFLKTISAMVDSLKGTQGAQRIAITIEKPAGEAEEAEK